MSNLVWLPSAQALPDQRVAYLFDEGTGTAVNDGSGNGSNATATGTSWTTAGRYRNALVFNGSSSRVRSTSNVVLNGSFTLEAWILNPTDQPFETIVTVGSNRSFFISNGVLGFYDSGIDVNFGAALATNTWHHVAVVADGSTVRAYVNGVQHGTTQNLTSTSYTGPIQVGAYISGPGNIDYYSGTIDEVRVYNRALAASEIIADMNAAGGPDTAPPVLANGQPSGSLAAGSTQAILQVTTDEAATCRYGTTADTAYAAMPTAFATSGGTQHSSPVTGLTNGSTYRYYVRCQDASTNANPADYTITFAVASSADATPPAVSVTAPANGASVSGTVSVTAAASDNVGVGGVQFLLDGTNLGAEDVSAPYSVSWNSGAATNGSHTLTARARDAAANQTTSSAVGVTVSNGAPTGQLLAYGFDEGSGTSIDDASPANTDATATATTWSSGRYGAGIVFDGVASRVRSNSSVTLAGSFTLEAWVLNPSNQAYETIVTVGSNRDVFLANGVLSLDTGGNTLSFGPALATTTWQHVAVVSDGSTVRAYVGGVQRGATQNLVLGSSTGAVQAGAWINGAGNADHLSGTLDEIRIHNRALSAADVQSDMVTPIGPAGPDSTAPALSNGAPAGTLAAGTTQAELQVTTNENATCRYGTVAGTAYGSMTNTFTTSGGTAHRTTVAGLTNGSSYTFRVRCQDQAGNTTTSDYVISFAVATPGAGGNDYSMRFFGNGNGDIDRVKIPLTTNRSIDVDGSFTLEWWMRAASGNTSGNCPASTGAGDTWINGRILFDRDIYGPPDNGDYGISLFQDGRLAFGVATAAGGSTLCSSSAVNLYDDQWHHVAATRDAASGQLCFYIDGTQRGCSAGPGGSVGYRDGRATGYPNSDPFLVVGAEKHDAGSAFPCYRGWMDELRVSNSVRYATNFTAPRNELSPDANTVALYHFDEGSNTTLTDATGNNNGQVRVGGNPVGPLWDGVVRPF